MKRIHIHGMRRQRGLAFLLAVLALILIGGATLFLSIGGDAVITEQRLRRENADIARLKVVKDALIGFAIGTYGGGARPGQLPLPDTLEDAPAVGSYDGNSNPGCLDGSKLNGLPPLKNSAAKSPNLRCIGRVPWRMLGLEPVTLEENDPSGLMVWYAVSANLADPNLCLERLNSGSIALSHDSTATFACPNPKPPFPWLKVCSESGRVLSSNVAFVLILPGASIATQGRTQERSPSKPQPSDFLDAIPLPTGWGAIPPAERCSTYDNAGLTNEFVIASQSDTFNDRLIYITTDELAAELERRVAFETRKSVNSFATLNGAFPWLAELADPTLPASFVPVAGTLKLSGLVPFYTTHTDNEFASEIGWTLTSAVSAPTASTTPSFFTCKVAGITQSCRVRTALGAAIPNSVTALDVQSYASTDVDVPTALCKWKVEQESRVSCTYAVDKSQSAPMYQVESRASGSAPWLACGSISGNTIRRLNMTFDFKASQSPPINPTYRPATTTSVLQRDVRNNSTSADNMIEIVDSFISVLPTCGDVNFLAASPLITGRGKSTGLGDITVRKIRVYPAMPEWYFSEQWYQYVYAALSPDVAPQLGKTKCDESGPNCLAAGASTGVTAVVIAVGKPLIGQDRTSPSPNNFLEGKNKDGATTKAFASSTETRADSYVDFVAPLVR